MEGKSQEVTALVRAYDGNIERQLRESGDKGASLSFSTEAFRRVDSLSQAGRQASERNTQLSALQGDGVKPTAARPDSFGRQASNKLDALKSDARVDADRQDTTKKESLRPDQIKIDRKKPEINKPDLSKPDAVTRTLGNWQADSRGNFVTADRGGRLLTLDQNGNKIDYQTHLDQAKSSERTQMTLGSLLFCSPFMMIGMGAAFSFMDHINGKGDVEKLRAKLEGPKKTETVKAYSPEMTKLAALTIYQDTRFSALNNMAGMGAMRIKDEADKSKKKVEQIKRVPPRKVSMAPDSITTSNLLKQKRRIENLLERIEGRASLAEISRLHSQLETLDRALTRLGNLSM